MRQTCVYLLVILLPAPWPVTSESHGSTSISATSEYVVDDVHRRGEGYFAKPQLKKPYINARMKGDLPQRLVHVAARKRPSSPVCRQLDSTCSPQLYHVRLQNGNCSRSVQTKVCNGLYECIKILLKR